jgi:hypothetical protein
MTRPVSTPSTDGKAASDKATSDKERREFPRRIVNEEAEFLIVEEDMRLPCVVVNISASGAKIACDAIPPSGSKVILFLKGETGIEAITARYEEKALGLKFVKPRV